MYDKDWARRIVFEIRENRTRTDLVDIMIVSHLHGIGKYWAERPMNLVLNAAIYGLRTNSKEFALYKKLMKGKNLPPKAMDELCKAIWSWYWRDYDDKSQRLFEFNA